MLKLCKNHKSKSNGKPYELVKTKRTCKICKQNAAKLKWCKNNKDKLREYNRQWYQKNKLKIKKRNKKLNRTRKI